MVTQQGVVEGHVPSEALEVLQEAGLLPIDAHQAVEAERVVRGRVEGAGVRIVAKKARAGDLCVSQTIAAAIAYNNAKGVKMIPIAPLRSHSSIIRRSPSRYWPRMARRRSRLASGHSDFES